MKILTNEQRYYNDLYEGGLKYLDILRCRVKDARYLHALFGDVLPGCTLTPAEAFEKIEFSPLFWAWWKAQNGNMANIIPNCIIVEILKKDGARKKPSRNTRAKRLFAAVA